MIFSPIAILVHGHSSIYVHYPHAHTLQVTRFANHSKSADIEIAYNNEDNYVYIFLYYILL